MVLTTDGLLTIEELTITKVVKASEVCTIEECSIDVLANIIRVCTLEVVVLASVLSLDTVLRNSVNQTSTTNTDCRLNTNCIIGWNRVGIERACRNADVRITELISEWSSVREAEVSISICFPVIVMVRICIEVSLCQSLPLKVDLTLVDRSLEWLYSLSLWHTGNLRDKSTIVRLTVRVILGIWIIGTRVINNEQITITVTILCLIRSLPLAVTVLWVTVQARTTDTSRT